jgi:hypothetical protein
MRVVICEADGGPLHRFLVHAAENLTTPAGYSITITQNWRRVQERRIDIGDA